MQFTAVLVSALAAVASGMAVEKRDGTCAQQPRGSGPTIAPDTPGAFRNSTIFSKAAQSAVTPTGYTRTFVNRNSATQATRYMGSTLLTSYAAAQCGSFCSQTTDCAGFNIYYERNPSLDPNAVGCPNPSSVTNIKCILWGTAVSDATATNNGQFRNSFRVVVSGSNGYNRAN